MLMEEVYDTLKIPLGTLLPLPCADCGSSMKLIFHVQKGNLFYRCVGYPMCKGSLKASKDGLPLGVPVNAEGRKSRQLCHEAMRDILIPVAYNKTAIYRALGRYFGMPGERDEKHIGDLVTLDEFEKFAEFCTKVVAGKIHINSYARRVSEEQP